MSADEPKDTVAPGRAVAMRLSGALLAVLALGTLATITMGGDGLSRFGFAYMAGRWSNPLWQTWDLALLWLGIPHGVLALYAALNAHSSRTTGTLWGKAIVALIGGTALVLGTLVILTFDPSMAQ